MSFRSAATNCWAVRRQVWWLVVPKSSNGCEGIRSIARLRADKLRMAALEATLEAYGRAEQNPTQQMIAATSDQIGARAQEFINRIKERIPTTINLKTIPGESAVGGGSAPTSPLPTTLICVNDSERTANQIEAALRNSRPPVLVRILQNQVVLDLRTVAIDEEAALEQAVLALG